MKHRIFSAILAAAMAATLSVPTVSAKQADPTESLQTVVTQALPKANASYDTQSVYDAMIALQDKYPSGMDWTNDNFYAWNGGIYSGGYGCAGFAFMLSDAAFGTLPARMNESFEPSMFRVGDILRYSSHSVIILEVHADYVVVAEGNINSMIYWGREISFDEMEDTFEHYLTRYPEDAEPIEPTPEPTPEPTEPTTEPTTEEPSDAYFELAVEIVSEPDKTEYLLGEELDLTGLTVNTWYTEMGAWLPLYSDTPVLDYPNRETHFIEVFGYDPDMTGEQEISVMLWVYNSALSRWVTSTAYFYVTVYEEEPLAYTLGDLDANGTVDAVDASQILVAATALGATKDSGLNAAQEAAADVNGDGAFDAVDASYVLQYATAVGAGFEGTLAEFVKTLDE